jgi:hypothetical protein
MGEFHLNLLASFDFHLDLIKAMKGHFHSPYKPFHIHC